jgi:DNA-binding NtrC family response regulator
MNRSHVMPAPRILIVEDDQDVRVPLDHAFSGQGYEVTTAAKATTALELLAQGQIIDVALLDYRLPDMDGLDLYHRIKDRQPDVLGVFVTAYATVDMIEAALNAGVCRVFPKPVDIPEVLDAVEEFVG